MRAFKIYMATCAFSFFLALIYALVQMMLNPDGYVPAWFVAWFAGTLAAAGVGGFGYLVAEILRG